MKEVQYIWSAILITVVLVLTVVLYQRHEDRKAYYECLETSERIAKQQSETRSYGSLPYCRI